MKKTISLKNMIEEVNRINQKGTEDLQLRQGRNDLLEWCLNQAGAYIGYGLLKQNEVPEGQTPGIHTGEVLPFIAIPDDTRRKYYIHESLK